jgi:hypothetical protein
VPGSSPRIERRAVDQFQGPGVYHEFDLVSTKSSAFVDCGSKTDVSKGAPNIGVHL